MKKYSSLLSLGSNLGARLVILRQALEKIRGTPAEIRKVSGVYETAPWGFESENAFYNLAVWLQTPWVAGELLEKISAIEDALGRERTQPKGYADRVIDIDIIYFEDWCLQTQDLCIPHPRRAERRFVLRPLVEIAPDFIDPEWGLSIRQLLEKTADRTKLKKLSGVSL